MKDEGYGVEERVAGNAFVFHGAVKVTRSRRATPASRAAKEAEQEASFGDDESSESGEGACRKRRRCYQQPSGLEAAPAGEPRKRSRAECIDDIVAEGDALELAERDSALYVGALCAGKRAIAVHTTKARNAAIQKGRRKL